MMATVLVKLSAHQGLALRAARRRSLQTGQGAASGGDPAFVHRTPLCDSRKSRPEPLRELEFLNLPASLSILPHAVPLKTGITAYAAPNSSRRRFKASAAGEGEASAAGEGEAPAARAAQVGRSILLSWVFAKSVSQDMLHLNRLQTRRRSSTAVL